MQLSASTSTNPFSIGSPTLAREIKDYMDKHRSQVESLLRQGGEGAGQASSGQWAKVFDGLLCALFCALRGSVTSEKAWSSLALAAVGSYGRGTFGYKSDLDIRILCKDPTQAKPVAEALLYPLWDAGIQIGHQVITLSDTLSLARQDLSTATTLLDWRHLAGNAGESRKLREKAFGSLFSGRARPVPTLVPLSSRVARGLSAAPVLRSVPHRLAAARSRDDALSRPRPPASHIEPLCPVTVTKRLKPMGGRLLVDAQLHPKPRNDHVSGSMAGDLRFRHTRKGQCTCDYASCFPSPPSFS